VPYSKYAVVVCPFGLAVPLRVAVESLTLDALFVVSPFPHFGFYAGPQANLSFAGTHSRTQGNGVELSWGASFRSLGLGLGLIGYVDL